MSFDTRSVDELHAISLWESPLHPEAFRAVEAVAEDTEDKAVGHKYGTDGSGLAIPLGDKLKDFGKWESVTSTIYNKLIRMAKFDPSNTEYSSAQFATFRTKFSECPYWNGIEFNILTREAKLKIKSYKAAVDAIFDLLDVGITVKVKNSILGNIKQIAQLASENVEKEQKQSLFQNGSLCVADGRLYIFFLYNFVKMKASKGKYSVIDQDCLIVRGYGVLDFDFCKRHADSILKYDVQNLADWENEPAGNHEKENESEGWPPIN